MTLVFAASSMMLRLFSGEAMFLFTLSFPFFPLLEHCKMERFALLVLATTSSITAGRDRNIDKASACVLLVSSCPFACNSSSPFLTRPDLEAEELGNTSWTK